MKTACATLSQLGEFDEIIDVRSPSEFADDHVAGAINCPVLDDAQRAEVGTLYKQVSPFEARKLGGAYVAQNIATHLRDRFATLPKEWRPLVYCWRGGLRSDSFITWLRLVGWSAAKLDGGYKSYRRQIVAAIDALPAQFSFRVLCGPTGCGKTRLLHALKAEGAQVIDLEALAAHRGSVLGALPGVAQPSQKTFEAGLVQALEGFRADQPVFIEAESRKLGQLYVPTALLARLRAAPCVVVEADFDARLTLLLEDYGHLGAAPEALCAKLGRLAALHSKDTLERWCHLARTAALATLFGELLEQHYDPSYRRSLKSHFVDLDHAPRVLAHTLNPESLQTLAAQLLGHKHR